MKMPDELTPQQKEAIEYTDSPLLIVAGPGTGKTRVLSEKVKYLVEKKNFDPNKILVTTFTVKAAEELKNKLRDSLGDKVETMQISTIHSFCQTMLESFPEYHNLGNSFQVFDAMDQYIYVDKNIWNFGLKDYIRDDDVDVDSLISFYNKATENDIEPQNLIGYLKESNADEKTLAIATSYLHYVSRLIDPQDTKLDFALIQREFFRLLKKNDIVLKRMRDMFDYILVDEYQDTNPIQDAIFQLISKPKNNICVVGDEDQSIYGFRGASISNFRSFKEKYGAIERKLEENFRSTNDVVNVCESVITPHRTISKTIYPHTQRVIRPIKIVSRVLNDEPKSIIKLIIKLKEEHNVNYGDIVILLKSVKFGGKGIIEELEVYNKKDEFESIPYLTFGDSSLFKQEVIVDLIILLGYVSGFEDDKTFKDRWLTLRNIFQSEVLDLSEKSVKLLDEKADSYNPFKYFNYDKLKRLGLVEDDINKFVNLKNLKKFQEKKSLSLLSLFYSILDATNFHKQILHTEDKKMYIHSLNVAMLTKLLGKFELIVNSKHFGSFIKTLTRIPDNKMEDSANINDIDAVKIMTIHQAKGLEFPVVILPGVTNRRYKLEFDDDKELISIPKELMMDKQTFDRGEELLRTFYVGLSRTQRILVISTINGPGSKPSLFLKDVDFDNFSTIDSFEGDLLDEEHHKVNVEKTKLSYSAVNAYIDCPYRFNLTYLLNYQTPQLPSQQKGVIIHACLKKLHSLMKLNEPINIQKVIEIVDIYCKDEDSKNKWRDEIITDLWSYYEETPKFIKEIVEIEYPFTYATNELVVNGQVDLIIRDLNNDLVIVDFKSFYAAEWSKLHVDVQLRMYNLAIQKIFKDDIERLIAFSFKDRRITEFSNTAEDLIKTQEMIIAIAKDMNENKFGRNWGSTFCQTKHGKCPFYGLCSQLEGIQDGK